MPATATQLFPWTKSLETGHPTIDQEHQQLVRYLNDLADAMRTGKGKAILQTLLDRLVDYTKKHFGHEEMLMSLRKYPEAAAHKAIHDELTKTVLDFHRKFVAGEPVNATDVLEFLRDWLRTHIGGNDRRLGAWLSEG